MLHAVEGLEEERELVVGDAVGGLGAVGEPLYARERQRHERPQTAAPRSRAGCLLVWREERGAFSSESKQERVDLCGTARASLGEPAR